MTPSSLLAENLRWSRIPELRTPYGLRSILLVDNKDMDPIEGL